MMTSAIIDRNNQKKLLTKLSHVNFRKSHEILDQLISQ